MRNEGDGGEVRQERKIRRVVVGESGRSLHVLRVLVPPIVYDIRSMALSRALIIVLLPSTAALMFYALEGRGDTTIMPIHILKHT